MASDVVMDSQDDEALGVQAAAPTDADFRAIFTSWKKMDNVAHATVSLPSRKPVDHISLNSHYGVRSDHFHGNRSAHRTEEPRVRNACGSTSSVRWTPYH